MTLGCAASEQVPSADQGALTQYLERKWGFSWGMGMLFAGHQTGRKCEVQGRGLQCPLSVTEVQRLILPPGCRHELESRLFSGAEFSLSRGEGVPWSRGVSCGC